MTDVEGARLRKQLARAEQRAVDAAVEVCRLYQPEYERLRKALTVAQRDRDRTVELLRDALQRVANGCESGACRLIAREALRAVPK